MSPAARQILSDFAALPENEREEVVVEVLTRHPIGSGDLPDAAFAELADELFQSLDAEE